MPTIRETETQPESNDSGWEIGYVAGIRYDSEGTLIDWDFGKDNLTGYGELAHVLPTIDAARKHLLKFGRFENSYIRPNFSTN